MYLYVCVCMMQAEDRLDREWDDEETEAMLEQVCVCVCVSWQRMIRHACMHVHVHMFACV